MMANYHALAKVREYAEYGYLLANTKFGGIEYFAGLIQRHPAFPSYSKAMYSNAAYRILAYVLEEITGKSFDEVVMNDVFQPLGMKHTSSLPPSRKGAGVIPDGDAGWSRVYGDEVA